MPVEPISPAECRAAKSSIPDLVFEEVNRLLVERAADPRRIVIFQKELLAACVRRGLVSETIFSSRWLDFEPYYRKKGWRVEYNSPGYNESFEASWVFSATR